MENRRPLDYVFANHPTVYKVDYDITRRLVTIWFKGTTMRHSKMTNAEWKQFITLVHESDKIKFINAIIVKNYNKYEAMITFQIIQNFGGQSKGYLYFKAHGTISLKDLRALALRLQKEDFDKRSTGFIGKAIEHKLIRVREYDTINHLPKKGGFQFTIQWRY